MKLHSRNVFRRHVPALSFVLFFAAGSLAMAQIAGGSMQDRLASEAPFLAQNDTAMNRMMKDMTIRPSGDVDKDFVDMMVPHHQGAIDMAIAVLRYGRNERIRRLAQEIIVTQQQEIAAMRLAVGERLPPSIASPTMSSTAGSPMVQSAADPRHGDQKQALETRSCP